MEGAREGRRNHNLGVTNEGKSGKGFFGMMVQRQVTSGWADDIVQRHGDGWGGRAGVGWLPPDVNWTSGREGGSASISKICKNKRRILGPEW